MEIPLSRVLPIAAALFLVSLAGCRTDEGRRERERAAVAAYHAASATAAEKQAAFVDAWRASRECPDVATLLERGRKHVLPALDSFIAALEATPVESKRLAELHGVLLRSWKQFRRDLDRFYRKTTAANLPKRAARLEASWSHLGALIVQYRRDLAAYYEGLGLHLAPADAAPDGAGAEEEVSET